jgi:flagellar basal-body rod protein FlgB
MMLFDDLANAGSAPVLERMLRFAGARQRLLAHDIANIDTPMFTPLDVSPRGFQQSLAAAVAKRRESGHSEAGELNVEETAEVAFGGSDGSQISLKPRTPSGNIMYHDRNNRDLERLMQSVAENQLMFKTASDLLKRQHDLLRTAISQRV